MELTLWIFQWIVAIVAYLFPLHYARQEYGIWGLLFFILVPPALMFYYIPTRWQRCKYAALVIVACVALAAWFQWGRLGYWAWPDVERAV
jgi:hypothetical protein